MSMVLSNRQNAATFSHTTTMSLGAWNADPATIPRGMPLMIPVDQAYYWTNRWQESERRAHDDLRAGRSQTFSDPGAAVRHLLDAG